MYSVVVLCSGKCVMVGHGAMQNSGCMSFGDTGEIYEIIKDEDFTWSHLYFNFACVTEAIKYKNVFVVE